MFANGLRVQTGPQLGILTSAKFYPTAGGETKIPNMNNVDFSWTAGVGYLSPIGLGIDARYNLGISNVYENSAGAEGKNRVWQFGIFYQFGK
jgi:hypothetical protein